MIKLHELHKNPKSMHRKKVVGRGLGSGKGTYSTRGNKGQTKRTGHSKMPANFEGGRQPLVRQLPKSRGFTSLNDKSTPVSLTMLSVFADGATVDLKALKDKKIVDIMTKKVKILGGEIKKKLNINLPISKSARQAVEKAGGQVK
jgi:large subunit ribosomal protein L15